MDLYVHSPVRDNLYMSAVDYVSWQDNQVTGKVPGNESWRTGTAFCEQGVNV
jgi:hypothetical protein